MKFLVLILIVFVDINKEKELNFYLHNLNSFFPRTG